MSRKVPLTVVLLAGGAVSIMLGFRLWNDKSLVKVIPANVNPQASRMVGGPSSAASTGDNAPVLRSTGEGNGTPKREFSREIYDSLAERHRRVRNHQEKLHLWVKPSGFESDATLGYLQARLLALCQPDEVEASALNILANPQAPLDDILFAVKVLGVLAAQGRPASETALLRVISSSRDTLAMTTALDCITSSDKEGRHRDIYWSKCLEKSFEAIEFGPYWSDQQTKGAITHIHKQLNTSTTENFYSQEAFDRLKILESPNRSEQLDQLLADSWEFKERSEAAAYREPWAIRMVQFSPTPATLDILRRRLDRGELEAASSSSGPVGSTQGGYQDETRDRHFDDCLLAYQVLGGQLNETESARLRYYGYLGNPKERLDALLAAEHSAQTSTK